MDKEDNKTNKIQQLICSNINCGGMDFTFIGITSESIITRCNDCKALNELLIKVEAPKEQVEKAKEVSYTG